MNDPAAAIDKNWETIAEALAGDNQDQREIAFIGLSMVAVMVEKNRDYGSSVFQIGTVSPDVTPEQGLRVRLGDKLSRLRNLISKPGNQRVNESLLDTGQDASAYLLLWVIASMRGSGAEICTRESLQNPGYPLDSELQDALENSKKQMGVEEAMLWSKYVDLLTVRAKHAEMEKPAVPQCIKPRNTMGAEIG
jgi:hypothetical protein